MALVNDYVAGLLDAQLAVSTCKRAGAECLKVTLANADERIGPVVRTVFPPSREVMIKTPKKTTCTLMYYGKDARKLLEFARDECKLVSGHAVKALAYLDAPDGGWDADVAADGEVPDGVSPEWAAGYFDVKGVMSDKPRASVMAPKGVADVPRMLETLSKTLGGKVKKNRVVFDTKTALRGLIDACGDHVHAKIPDFDRVRKMIN